MIFLVSNNSKYFQLILVRVFLQSLYYLIDVSFFIKFDCFLIRYIRVIFFFIDIFFFDNMSSIMYYTVNSC